MSFGSKEFWDTWYTNIEKAGHLLAEGTSEDPEWYLKFETLKQPLLRRLQNSQQAKLLIVGCGCSDLGEKLHAEGFSNIICIDFSVPIIEYMRRRYANGLVRYEVADVTELPYGSGTFDIAIDKGTIESIKCASDSGTQLPAAFREVRRVLVPDGQFILIGPDAPEKAGYDRLPGWKLLESYEITAPAITKGSQHHESLFPSERYYLTTLRFV